MMQQKPQEKQQMKTLKQIVKESDFANPKSPGDKAFVDKHVIQKTDYPHKPKDGSNDDIFSGKKQKRKKKRTDHEDDKAVYEMSDAQMKRKEEIVKGMKKNTHEFIKRYGKDAESVMHATATKQAQTEDTVLESIINATEDKVVTVENKEFKLTLEDSQALKKIYESLNDENKKEFEQKLLTKSGTQQLISFASQWGV